MNASSRDNGRKERGNNRDKGGNGGKRGSGFERFFINIGRRDGLNPVRLMGVINEQLRGDKPDFGKIEIQNNFSFFEVEPGYADKLFRSVKDVSFEGRGISIEAANQPERKKFRSSKKKRSKR